MWTRKRLIVLMWILSVVTVGASLLSAAEPQADPVPVSMVVTVRPIQGKRPAVVNQDDIRVYKGKQRLQVTGWQPATGGHAALGLFILIDETAGTSLGSQLGDIKSFITEVPSNTQVGVGYMSNAGVRVVQNFTADAAAAAKAVRLPLSTVSAMDSPYLSLRDLIKRWPANNARREVLMISDGIDRMRLRGNMMSLPSISVDAQSVADLAQRERVIVHTIYTPGNSFLDRNFWLANMGENNLSMLSDVTGGASFFLGFQNPPSFKPWLDQLHRILENQYWLTFEANPGKKGGLQYVRLETEVPGAELLSANAVYVPAAK